MLRCIMLYDVVLHLYQAILCYITFVSTVMLANGRSDAERNGIMYDSQELPIAKRRCRAVEAQYGRQGLRV